MLVIQEVLLMRFSDRGRATLSVGAILFVLLFSTSCVGERNRGGYLNRAIAFFANASCGDYYLDEISSGFSYHLDSTTAGDTTGLTMEMTFPNTSTTPILATYEVSLTVPSQFTFLGFDALGSGAEIGAWEFEWSNVNGHFDGADFTILHRSIDFASGYSDSDGSGSYSPGIDPTVEYTTGTGGKHIITLTLPDGGMEQGTHGMCSYFSFDARYTLLDGIVALPTTPGDYTIEIVATSVDLDTGNATDNTPPHPLIYANSFVLTIVDQDSIFTDGFESGNSSAWSGTVG